MSYIWSISLVVVSNIFYQICRKSASMTVAYLVGTIASAVMFFITNRGGNLFQESSRRKAAPVLPGISAVGLEVGLIYAYRSRWPVSTASTVQSGFLSLALVVAGTVLYHRKITFSKVIGTAICLIGLYFNKSVTGKIGLTASAAGKNHR